MSAGNTVAQENEMNGLVSKLLGRFYTKAAGRPVAVRRQAAMGFEPLDARAVLSTITPIAAPDDAVEQWSAAGEGGGGAGKVQMNDFHFVARSASAGSSHPGG